VGGFYRVPTRQDLDTLVDRLRWARDAAVETARLVAGFDFPDLVMDYEFVSLRHPAEYPMNEGRFVSSSGLDIAVQEYEFHFEERHVAHSNALSSSAKGIGNYHVGPLARVSLNFDRLSPLALEVCRDIGFALPVRNPFRSIIARAIETVYACDEALRICGQYEQPPAATVDVVPRAGIGFGATEAPRGTLYHRYRVGSDGLILDAKIVPPTAQNQPTIERDVRQFVETHMELSREDLTWKCEQAVRNYDPCISCATHFVRLDIDEDRGRCDQTRH
jgi:coenzyme F420-reducing hydrogenase alpha subunit